MTSIAILMTSYNRKNTTLACLHALHSVQKPANCTLSTYLVVDGSTDGTEQAVRANFPEVKILMGDGSLYWNRGMHLAFATASKENFDFYLWLNDDTILFTNALANLLSSWEYCQKHTNPECIIVGSTCDEKDYTKLTYGGYRKKKGMHPFNLCHVLPSDELQQADTMNGNIVLIPRNVFKKIGNLNVKFIHNMGDNDYGFRACKAGCTIMIAPKFLGTCSRDQPVESWKDATIPFRSKLKIMLSIKELPFKDYILFSYCHGGLLWPLWAISPYVKLVGKALLKK